MSTLRPPEDDADNGESKSPEKDKARDPNLERLLSEAREIIAGSDAIAAANVLSADAVMRIEKAMEEAGFENVSIETMDPSGQAVFMDGHADHPALREFESWPLPPVNFNAGIDTLEGDTGGNQYMYSLDAKVTPELAGKLKPFLLQLDPSIVDAKILNLSEMLGDEPDEFLMLLLQIPAASLENTAVYEEIIKRLGAQLNENISE